MMSTRRTASVLTIAMALLSVLAGCVSLNVLRLADRNASPDSRADAARALRSYWDDPAATKALIVALDDSEDRIRDRAAEALETHVARASNELRFEACAVLIRHLDDRGRGVGEPLRYWWEVVWQSAPTAPVRYRAAMALVIALHADHGFDVAAWSAELERQRSELVQRSINTVSPGAR